MPTLVEHVDGSARGDLALACPDLREAARGDAVDGVAPALVARPASTAEVSAVMRAAGAHGLAVVVRGRGTKLTWGRPPSRLDVLLDLGRMDAVLDHAPGDLIVVAQAGAGIDDLQQAVSSAGQRLAVDGGVRGSSVGGTIATATSGPRRLATGTVRDLLIGVTLVLADGTVARAGGRVVKNVAGYDLCKLVTGSFGTLAVVTEAVFRLHPLPADARYVSVTANSPDELARLAHTVRQSQSAPTGIEVDRPAGGPGTLTVLLEGTTGGVAARAEAVAGLLGPTAGQTLLPPDWWALYPWSATSTGSARATALKITHRLGALADVLQVAAGTPTELHLRGSGGTGVIYGAIPPEAAGPDVLATVAALREVTGRNGGTTVVLDATDEVKAALDSWGPVPAIDLMRRVKAQFDPACGLAPGRFVGGI